VRCSKCRFIFIVYPPEFNERPNIQDTNIDQSILNSLFRIKHAVRTKLPLDVVTDEWNNFFAQGALSIDAFDEKTSEEPDLKTDDADCTGLPDLSEYENMIDWGDTADSEAPSEIVN
jgi:hypothetical protein